MVMFQPISQVEDDFQAKKSVHLHMAEGDSALSLSVVSQDQAQ